MKVKILIAPLLIVSIIGLLIWLVYPAYSNGIDGVKEKRDEYNKEKETLDVASQKTANLESLSTVLTNDANKPRQDLLFKFIPDSLKEEDIINNLNYLAGNEGLSVVNISIAQPDKAVVLTSGLVNTNGQPIPVSAGAPAVVVPELFKVNFSVLGSYDKIKNVLGEIYNLERFNDVSSLAITEGNASQTAANQTNGDNLQATAVFEFALFNKSPAPADPLDPAFNNSNFDWGIIQSITDSKNTDVLNLSVDSSGRSNPFLP